MVEYICKVELWAGYQEKVVVFILSSLDILLYRAQSQGLKSRWSHLGKSSTLGNHELLETYDYYIEELSLPQIGQMKETWGFREFIRDGRVLTKAL